jgi:hypothetical protein
MESIWRQLIEPWRLQNLPIQKVCREEDILCFETRQKITLAPDIREYFLNVNGMTPYFPGYQDGEGFSFWPLENVRTLAEENDSSDRGYLRIAERDSFFLFSDYLDWSWAYAVKILPGSCDAEGIYLLCCNNPIRIADSFSDFMRMYLGKSDQLYPPAAHEHI